MSYQITDSDGVTSLRPEHSKMVEILNDLYDSPLEAFEEATLTHASGVAITLASNGSAVMDTPDSESYSILVDLSFNDQMSLWIQLATGNIDGIRSLEWQPS